jgi:hypothetical protein
MSEINSFAQRPPAQERPAYQRFLITLVTMLAIAMVGYAVGKMAAGSFDFSALQLGTITASLMIIVIAIHDLMKKGAKAKTLIIQTLIGAVVGFVIVGGGLLLFAEPFEKLIKTGSPWQWAGAVVGGLYMLFGLMLLPMGFIRKLPNIEEMTPAELVNWHAICRWSALVSFAYGAAIFFLIAGSMQAAASPSWAIFGGVLVSMLVQAGGTWLLWKRYDELWRAATRDACFITFMAFEVIAVLWAGLTLAGFAVVFDPLGVVVLMSAVYLAANFIITIKRGMADV